METITNTVAEQEQPRTVGIFIDGANLFHGLREWNSRIDFGDFREWLADGRKITVCDYFNAGDPDNENTQKFFKYLGNNGYKTYIRSLPKMMKNKELQHKEKQSGVDVYLAVKAMLKHENFDVFIIVTGDYDFLPLISEMESLGKRVEVVSFEKSMHPIYNKFNPRFLDPFVRFYGKDFRKDMEGDKNETDED